MLKIKKNTLLYFMMSLIIMAIAVFSVNAKSKSVDAEEKNPELNYVYYLLNGGTGNVPVDNNGYADSSYFTILENNISRNGYTFGFWFEVYNSFDTGQTYQLGTNDVNLFAFWYKIITLDETAQSYEYSGNGCSFIIKDSTDNLNDFTIKYAPHSDSDHVGTDWTTEAPKNIGSYDVYITRERDNVRDPKPTEEDVYHKLTTQDKTYDGYTKEIKNSLVINKIKVAVPTANTNLVYTGSEITGVTIPNNAVYTITENKKTDAGSYTAVATLTDKEHYVWDLETPTSDDQNISWSIAKKKVS